MAHRQRQTTADRQAGAGPAVQRVPVLVDEGDVRDILAKMRHDGCGGRAGKVELLTSIEGVSSRPVRKIVLREG